MSIYSAKGLLARWMSPNTPESFGNSTLAEVLSKALHRCQWSKGHLVSLGGESGLEIGTNYCWGRFGGPTIKKITAL